MDGEHAYWAGLSGLTPAAAYSLADHIRAAGQDPYPGFAYWAGESGLTPATSYPLSDHKLAAIAGGGPGPSAGYGLGPYGTMPYGQ